MTNDPAAMIPTEWTSTDSLLPDGERAALFAASFALLLLLAGIAIVFIDLPGSPVSILAAACVVISVIVSIQWPLWGCRISRPFTLTDPVLFVLFLYLWFNSKVAIISFEANDTFRIFILAFLSYVSASFLYIQIPRIVFLALTAFLVVLLVVVSISPGSITYSGIFPILSHLLFILGAGLLLPVLYSSRKRVYHGAASVLFLLTLLSLSIPFVLQQAIPERLYAHFVNVIPFSHNAAVNLLSETPYLGIGLGGFPHHFHAFPLPSSIKTSFLTSSYLYLAVESGVVGVSLLVLFVIGGPARLFMKRIRTLFPIEPNTPGFDQKWYTFTILTASLSLWLWWCCFPVYEIHGFVVLTFLLTGTTIGACKDILPARKSVHVEKNTEPLVSLFRSSRFSQTIARGGMMMVILVIAYVVFDFVSIPGRIRNIINTAEQEEIVSETYRNTINGALSLQPDNPLLYMRLAHHYRNYSALPGVDPESVFIHIESAYKKAIQCNPFDENPYYQLARLYILRQDYEPAIELLETTAKHFLPCASGVELYLARCFEEIGELHAAVYVLEHASQLNPLHAYLNLRLAVIGRRIKNAPLALKHCRYFLQKKPLSLEGVLLYRSLKPAHI